MVPISIGLLSGGKGQSYDSNDETRRLAAIKKSVMACS
jgi:hypothetical protein